MTAIREASPLGRPLQPILLCATLGGAAADLHCPTWRTVMYRGAVPACQALADRLIAAGYAGMQVRSFAAGAGPDDVNLVFWRWGDRLPSRVVVIDDQGRLPKAGESRKRLSRVM